jgi:hypothetical protein
MYVRRKWNYRMLSHQAGEDAYWPTTNCLNSPSARESDPLGVMARALEMAAVVAEIAGEYDIHNMTPPELAEMAGRLYVVGAIGVAEYAALSFRPDLYPDFCDQVETYRAMQEAPETPRNFLAAWEKHLDYLRSHHPHPRNLALCEQIVNLLQSFTPLDEWEA